MDSFTGFFWGLCLGLTIAIFNVHGRDYIIKIDCEENGYFESGDNIIQCKVIPKDELYKQLGEL